MNPRICFNSIPCVILVFAQAMVGDLPFLLCDGIVEGSCTTQQIFLGGPSWPLGAASPWGMKNLQKDSGSTTKHESSLWIKLPRKGAVS